MSKYIFSCGNGDIPMENRAYANVQTTQAKNICIGIESSGIPYSANFTDKELKLTYDCDYHNSVDEIMKKAQSGDYEEMFREIKEYKDGDGYLILLPTVAHYLHTTEGALKRRPEEQQERLCRLFVNFWFADTPTIQRELSRAMVVNRETEQDMRPKAQPTNENSNTYFTRDTLHQQAEYIRRKQAERDRQSAERENRSSREESEVSHARTG